MRKSKTITILVTIFSLCLIETNKAGGITDATNSFKSGIYTEAVDLFQKAINGSKSDWKKAELNLGLGASAFKINNFDIAASAFGSALLSNNPSIQETAYYNLGNSLYRKGENELKNSSSETKKDKRPSVQDVITDWEGAIENYESALGLNQNNANAKHNLEVVRRKLEELKDQENQDQENQDQENQDQENLSENKKINPETGYSKEQAQRQLEALANEQFLRALPRRSRARFKKDW